MTKLNDALSEMAAALFPVCESDPTRTWGWLPLVRRGRMWAVRGATIIGVPLPVSSGIGISETGVMVPAGGARPDGSQSIADDMPRAKADAAALRALKAAARTAETWTLSAGKSAGTVNTPDPEQFAPKSIAGDDATAGFLSVNPSLIAEVGKALERILGCTSIQLVASVSSGTSLPAWHIFAREALVEGVPPTFGFEFAPSPDHFRWVGVIAPTDVGGVDIGTLEGLICEKVPRRKAPKATPEHTVAARSKARDQAPAADSTLPGCGWNNAEDNPDA